MGEGEKFDQSEAKMNKIESGGMVRGYLSEISVFGSHVAGEVNFEIMTLAAAAIWYNLEAQCSWLPPLS